MRPKAGDGSAGRMKNFDRQRRSLCEHRFPSIGTTLLVETCLHAAAAMGSARPTGWGHRPRSNHEWETIMGLLSGTVFDRPPHCERCDRPETECQCPHLTESQAHTDPRQQKARLSTEKRKKGKVVTLIRGLSANENDLPKLLTQLKNVCAAGGAMDGDVIEIQGEHTERIAKTLKQIGYQVQ